MGDWESKNYDNADYDDHEFHVRQHRKMIRNGHFPVAYDPHGNPHEPLPQGRGGYPYVIFDEMPDEPPECKHEPIDVGFRFSKWVCKKCDKNLKEGKDF